MNSEQINADIFHSRTFIDFSMVSDNGVLKPAAWLSLLSSATERALLNMNIGVTKLIREHNLTWIMLSCAYEIQESPICEEFIHIETWHSNHNGALFNQQFRFYHENGERIADAVANLAVFDLESRKLCHNPPIPSLSDGKCLFTAPVWKQVDCTHTAYLMSQTVLPSWLDKNGHVNNSRYGDLIFDSATETVRQQFEHIERMEIFYLSELKLGDIISIFRSEAAGEAVYIASKQNMSKPAFVARCIFKHGYQN